MQGHEHYREAERLIAVAEGTYWEGPTAQAEFAQTCLAAAQAHATLALVAATVEAADHHTPPGRFQLINRPTPGDDVDPAYPGTPWGRALYGDLHTSTDKDS